MKYLLIKKYKVDKNEYTKIYHNEYNNLRLYDELSIHERIIGLIKKCKKIFIKRVDDDKCNILRKI